MNYSKEEFLQLYEQWRTLRDKINEALNKKVSAESIKVERDAREEVYKRMENYAIKLVEQNPDNKEIACIVYSAFDFYAPRLYTMLSDRLKNDKLVTMLALKKFDESAYARVGTALRSDPEVMYLLIKNVDNVNGLSQCSSGLLHDTGFWREIFESRNNCLGSEVGNNFSNVMFNIERMNEKIGLNIDINQVNSQFAEAMRKKSRYSPLDVMNLYSSGWTTRPEIVQKILDGDVKTIEENIPVSKLKNELLIGQEEKTEEQTNEITK